MKGPDVAPAGTGALIEVAVHTVGKTTVPLNVTVLDPWVDPKLVPVMVTDVATGPETGEILAIEGRITVKDLTLLAEPATVTTTFPEVAREGTGALMEVALQNEGVAATPLNVTELDPWVEPKLVPVMVTDVPTVPEAGDRLVIEGTITVKLLALLAEPATVTTTFPEVAREGTGALMEVALQNVGVAATPLNFTELDPWAEPKLVPVMVTDVPAIPEAGDRLAMEGAAPNAAGTTSNDKTMMASSNLAVKRRCIVGTCVTL